MTAKTPIYEIEWIQPGEPIRNTRLALENNAKTIEAALVRGGIAPPAAQDLATLAGRVSTLETDLATAKTQLATVTADTGWQPLTMTSPWTATVAQYRVRNRVCWYRISATRAAWTGRSPACTLPVGARPAFDHWDVNAWGSLGGEARILSTGVIDASSANNIAGLVISGSFPID